MDPDNREYKNDDITVFWKPGYCIHATTCYRELIEVFNPRKRPWVDMKGAPTERIIEVVKKCPTRALTYKWNDKEKEGQFEENEKQSGQSSADEVAEDTEMVSIQVMKDGPLVVQGKFEIYDADGKKLRAMSMTSFCRCGNSRSMPFCDGTHRKIGFNK